MPFLVAHKDNCDIGVMGPTHAVPVSSGFQDVATICNCGGLPIKVEDAVHDNPGDDARIYTIRAQDEQTDYK